MQNKRWLKWAVALAFMTALAACGGGDGDDGAPAGPAAPTFRAATVGDLTNKTFPFTADQQLFGQPGVAGADPRAGQGARLTIGSFAANVAAYSLVSDNGTVEGGSIALGSCTATTEFLATPDGQVILPGDPAFPADAVILLNPCEVDQTGVLRFAADGRTSTSSAPAAADDRFAFDMIIRMSPTFEVQPAVPLDARPETGTARLTLFRNTSVLSYTLTVSNLTAGDALIASHIHTGGVVQNGGVRIALATEAQFAGGTAVTASLVLTDQELADLTNPANPFYVNVHSTQVGGGLLRGQLRQDIVLASNVALAPPAAAAGRTETGAATLRVLSDNTLAFNLRVDNLSPTDSIVNAHIHEGSSTQDGAVFITLVGGPNQVGQEGRQAGISFVAENGTDRAVGQFLLTAEEVAALTNPGRAFYVQIHSNEVAAGLLRGQIRDVVVASLGNRIQPIFTSSCALTGVCHIAQGAAPMSLEPGQSFATLVNQPSTSAASTNQLRVAPSNSAASELIRRLTASDTRIRMPLGLGRLPDTDVELIRAWIDAGAPNN